MGSCSSSPSRSPSALPVPWLPAAAGFGAVSCSLVSVGLRRSSYWRAGTSWDPAALFACRVLTWLLSRPPVQVVFRLELRLECGCAVPCLPSSAPSRLPPGRPPRFRVPVFVHSCCICRCLFVLSACNSFALRAAALGQTLSGSEFTYFYKFGHDVAQRCTV